MPENDRINTSLPDNSAKGSLKVSLTSSLTAAPLQMLKYPSLTPVYQTVLWKN